MKGKFLKSYQVATLPCCLHNLSLSYNEGKEYVRFDESTIEWSDMIRNSTLMNRIQRSMWDFLYSLRYLLPETPCSVYGMMAIIMKERNILFRLGVRHMYLAYILTQLLSIPSPHKSKEMVVKHSKGLFPWVHRLMDTNISIVFPGRFNEQQSEWINLKNYENKSQTAPQMWIRLD